MSKVGIVREFWSFLKVRKKWWITPIVLFLVALGGLLVLAKGSALAPFIYSLFYPRFVGISNPRYQRNPRYTLRPNFFSSSACEI
jgi:hypothetical protein